MTGDQALADIEAMCRSKINDRRNSEALRDFAQEVLDVVDVRFAAKYHEDLLGKPGD